MRKLLVVDDEIDVCDFVKNFFEERGIAVLVALNGTEAVSLVQRDKPDMILLDIKMPGIDGLSTLRQIREIQPDARVVMVTALDDKENMDEAYRCGATDYITKPLILDNLEEMVFKTIGKEEDRTKIL
jgi:DNA-binding response OmpR family regulator